MNKLELFENEIDEYLVRIQKTIINAELNELSEQVQNLTLESCMRGEVGVG